MRSWFFIIAVMLKIPFIRWLRLRYAIWRHHGNNLQWRFIVRVLAPPFLILLLLGILGLWQLDKYIRNQAISELDRAAISTSAKLEREFTIRQTILKRTGEDLFNIKSDYVRDRLALDKKREDCAAYIKLKKSFLGAPNGICDPFLSEFALKGTTLLAIEDSYVRSGNQLIHAQEQKIQDRLAAYNQFFPETRVLLVADDKQQVVSSATSSTINASTDAFLPYLKDVKSQTVEGRVVTLEGLQLAVFAYPVEGGSVLAAYNLASKSFIKQTWDSTPIDRSRALAVILDSTGKTAYPNTQAGDIFKDYSVSLRHGQYTKVNLNKVPHIAVAAESGAAKWLVVVASPEAVVFGPLRDAQLAAVLVIGFLLVGFLWVGAIFIQRTVRSIMWLVSGALLFAGGKLNYTIRLPNADKEFTQLAETMNVMAWRIADAEKQIDEKNKEFISIATHELRTPLTAILGNLSMAVEDFTDQLNGPVKSIVDQAYQGTIRLRDLVNDMLDMARLEGGRVEFVIEKQNIQKLISEVAATLKVTADMQQIGIDYNSVQAKPVLADASKLRIVLNNFVSNAIKYNRPGGHVKVYHQYKDGKLVTAVSDSGLGIPDDQKAHMFEKFFRVSHPDRKDVVGTGLGMYVTKRYVLAMGGQVWFESAHGTGTTFYFSLPVSEVNDEAKSISQRPDIKLLSEHATK